MGGLGGTGDEKAVHCLPGTNHHYRVFRCKNKDEVGEELNLKDELWSICNGLHI